MDKQPTLEPLNSTIPIIKKPIARVLSLRLAITITFITFLIGIASYFHSISTTQELIIDQLMKFINERGLRESALFIESEDYQLRFQKEYVERYIRMGDKDPTKWFENHMEKRPEDGTYRSKPELYYGKDRLLGRRDVSSSMMIGANTKITPDILRALAIGYDMINQYGPAWRKPFVDLYFSSPEKTSVSRWPGTPWGLMMDDKVEWRDEEWMAITMKDKNPQREQRWSGVLYDERNGDWMVSGVTPLDIDGKQVGMVGTDLLLDDLITRTINETVSGSYNILLQADGRVIAHPHKVEAIIASKGMLTAQTSTDQHLQRIYEITKKATGFPIVFDNEIENEFIAVTQIQGPDWYFITVYPRSLLADRALRIGGFVFLLGMISLMTMVLVIWFVLSRHLVYPLERLTHAVRNYKILQDQQPDHTDVFMEHISSNSSRPDEIGLLTYSFVEMSNRLQTTYNELEKNKKELIASNRTFQALVESTVGHIGQGFFDNLVNKLSTLLDCECTILGKISGKTSVKALSMTLDGETIKDFSYQLSKTPCENVAKTGFCHYPEKVSELFPDDINLVKMNAVGFVGIPVLDDSGNTIGILHAISRNYLKLPDKTEAIMSILATRAAAEIERFEKENERTKLTLKLQQAQKMEAIGTLAGGIAHDFNNILGAILGYSEMAKEDAPPGTELERDLNEVLNAANRAKDLVQQILAFSRQAEVERIPIKIQPLIKEGLKMLRSSIPSTISIAQDIDPKSRTILADPTQVHQILMNLCTNAYHAMADTGGVLSVTLKTTFIRADNHKMLLHCTTGEYVEFTVTDNGIGIKPDILDKIFEPYFTTKDIGKGTGMGLSIIHGIMKDYKGAITVESQTGKGSTFHVYFPVIKNEILPTAKEHKNLPKGNERVLFIDDEEILAKMGKKILERLGYQVTVHLSSIDALATFQNTPNEFDIVLTDQTMPEMTGSDLALKMMQIRPDIPIVLCTGHSNLIDENSAKAIGIKEFALKPLTKEVIAKLIRKAINGTA